MYKDVQFLFSEDGSGVYEASPESDDRTNRNHGPPGTCRDVSNWTNRSDREFCDDRDNGTHRTNGSGRNYRTNGSDR